MRWPMLNTWYISRQSVPEHSWMARKSGGTGNMLSLHLPLPSYWLVYRVLLPHLSSLETCIGCPGPYLLFPEHRIWIHTHPRVPYNWISPIFLRLSRFHPFFIVKGASVYLHETTVSVSAQACWALAFEPSYFLFRPAASQASAKKSTSIVNWPTFLSSLSFSAFRLFSSLLSECSSPNTDPDFSRNSFSQSVICLGATPYFLASSDRVSFSFNASRTTFVLNAVKLAFSSHIFLDLLQRYAFYVPLVLSKFWGVLY